MKWKTMLAKRIRRKLVEPLAPLLFNLYFKKQRRIISKNKAFCVYLSFDCDLPEDIEALPDLLDLLRKYRLRASFACIGKWIEKYPKIHKRIIREDHEIINHTYSHPDNEVLSPTRFFNKIPYEEQKAEIKKCHDVCRKILHYEPVGFRTPHFGRLHCDSVYKILRELNYVYSSSTILARTKCEPHDVNGILEMPMMTCPDHFFPLFDTWHCYRSEAPAHTKPGEFFTLFKKAVCICKNNGVACVFYFDPHDLIRHKDEWIACLQWLKENKILTKKCKELAVQQ